MYFLNVKKCLRNKTYGNNYFYYYNNLRNKTKK